MKKFLSVLLAVMLTVTCFATVASAAGSASVSGNDVTAEAGSEVTLDINITGEFNNFGLYVTAADPLTVTDVAGAKYNPANNMVGYNNPNGENISSLSLTVSVSVGANAEAGKSYPVNVTVDRIYDADQNVLLDGETITLYVTIPAHEHSWSEWKTTKEATCTETGLMTRTCACGESETKVIEMIPHSMETEWSKDGKNHWHECSVCGHIEDEAAHTWDNGVETVAPGEETEGEMIKTCTVCGQTKTESIPALDHECSEEKAEWVTVVAPTCTEEGLKQLICSCGEVLDEKVVPALGHDYIYTEIEGDDEYHLTTCSRCDYNEKEEHEYGYDHICDLCEHKKAEKPSNPDKDDVLKTGDITPYITFTAAALIAMVAAAGYVLKRKFVK